MKMYSECYDRCDDCVTHYTGGCIAGHGDNDFTKITEDMARDIIKKRIVKDYLIGKLKAKFPLLKL